MPCTAQPTGCSHSERASAPDRATTPRISRGQVLIPTIWSVLAAAVLADSTAGAAEELARQVLAVAEFPEVGR